MSGSRSARASEVEAFGVLEFDVFQMTVFVLGRLDEFLNEQLVGFLCGGNGLADGLFPGLLARQDNSQEHAVAAVHGDHTVRCGGVVINGVALFQDLGVLTDLNLQLALQNQVKFLTGVRGEVNGLVLLGCGIFVSDVVRLCDGIAEFRCQMFDVDAVFLCGLLTLAAPCDGVA